MRKLYLTALAAILLPIASAPAHAQQATIHRDAWGTPHVFSDTDNGVMFGMAWALAEDDWTLIEENYLHAIGRYAELVGEGGVNDDWMARALEIVPLSVREYQTSSPRLRGLLDSYAAGLNAWLAKQPASTKRVLQRIEPWYPIALLRYKYYQNEYLGYAGLRGDWAKRLKENGLPAPKAVGNAGSSSGVVAENDLRYYEAQFDEFGFRPRGSNQWALAGTRTKSGHPMLLINPHQSFVGVQRYAEIHLDSREGMRFAGLTVFGFLLPYMGHSDRLGWAYTDNAADHSDLYGEVFDDPANPLRYRYGSEHRTATEWTDSIRVRVDGQMQTRTFKFWKTHHGPIVGISPNGVPVAAKLSRMEEGGWYAQWDAMIRARKLDEWKKAVAQVRVAYMNTMYADVDGNIGYIYYSAVPRRKPGVDPSGVLDGSDPNTEWQGFHPLEDLPQVFNPASGWLLNSNSTPFTATIDVPYKRSDFPSYMVGSENDNPRARSSRRVLENLKNVTFEEWSKVVLDTRLSVADSIIPVLLDEWAKAPSQKPGLAAAVERLRKWNRVSDAASVETLWFNVMFEQYRLSMVNNKSATPYVDALGKSLDLLQQYYGTTEVPWGTFNRHQRPLPGAPVALDTTRLSLGVSGAPSHLGSVFTIFMGRPSAASPVAPRLAMGGNSFVMAIEFTPVVKARSILNYGQSGDPSSPHFFDQAQLYARKEFKPAWFSREEVTKNSKRTYTVGTK